MIVFNLCILALINFKNLSHEDFKYLLEEFSSKNLELLKQKGDYPCEYINSFERFNEEKLAAKKYFFSLIKKKKERLVMVIKYQTVT